jgi:hypothetical protein
MSSFDILLSQIDSFIRKYYKNEMIKGLILFIGIFIFSFLFVVLLEYFGRFNTIVRTFMFFAFVILNLYLFGNYFFLPLLKIFSFGKRINRSQASYIIGKFFPDISDRLLNTLQLNDSLNNNNVVNFELIRASVQQRSKSLSVIPFSNGIDLKKNLSRLKYTLPIIFVLLLISIFFPTIVKQGTNRVVNFNQEFIPESPFSFILKSSISSIQEGEDLPIELILKGNSIPEKVYVVSSNGKYLMNKTSKTNSFIILKRIKSDVSFYFEANNFKSTIYHVNVIPKSSIGTFIASINYPKYLGKKNEVVSNVGDLTIPQGTIINYTLSTKNVIKTELLWNKFEKQIFKNSKFRFNKQFLENENLKLNLYNLNTNFIDSVKFKISVIPDLFPTIEVNEEIDSISEALRFFSGSISDDYGLSSLYFIYKIISKNGQEQDFKVKLNHTSGVSIPFTHAIDFRRENLKIDDKIEYYFLVYDNDDVNGSKSTRSKSFVYELPSLSKLNNKRDEANENSKEKLNQLLKKTEDFQKDVQKIKKEVLNSKSTDWNQMNQLQQLKEQQQTLNEELEQLQLQMNESFEEKNQLSEMDKEFLEKQELLQDLLDKIMDDELKDLLNKLEEMFKNHEKNKLEPQLEKLEMKTEYMNKQMDRSLEMLKRMQVNEKVEDIVKELKELSKEQEKLKEKIDDKKLDSQIAEEKQNEINKKFDELKKEIDELKSLNDELKSPLNLGVQDDIKNEITEELNKAKENLSKKNEKKASENQSKSAKKMDQMANELEMMQQESSKQQQEEDIESLRNILESLMILSFNQEDILTKFTKVKDKDPYYNRLGKNQRKIIDDTKIVEDSLNSLAMRQPKIASFINKELNDIHTNFKFGLENIDEHRKKELNSNLQYVMTSYNNLALMLNESLQQMQNEMQNSKPGSGSCDKPGGKGKKPSDSDSQDMKEMLKKQLEKMQKGQNPNGEKPGNKPGQKPGEQGMNMLGLGNKEIAKMAAEQTAIRQKLEQMRNELNKEGKGKGNQLNPLINELEQQEKDLINKQFSKDILKRQKEILTRLLESEKALLERGFEEKRESKSGKNEKFSNQNRIDEYNNEKLKQIELLRSVDPVFKKYYKDKASEYFNIIN